MPVVNYHTVNGQMVGQSTGTTFTQYLTDALGSVTATVNGKRVTNTYRYKPYGERLAKTGTGPDPDFQWTGDTGSRVTGRSRAEQYNRARHYGTGQASWSSVDPVWPSELAYTYALANPIVYLDFMGFSSSMPNLGGLSCKAMNDFIYKYCNICYRNPDQHCRSTCHLLASQYYVKCKSKLPPFGPGIWSPPRSGPGDIAPRPLPNQPSGKVPIPPAPLPFLTSCCLAIAVDRLLENERKYGGDKDHLMHCVFYCEVWRSGCPMPAFTSEAAEATLNLCKRDWYRAITPVCHIIEELSKRKSGWRKKKTISDRDYRNNQIGIGCAGGTLSCEDCCMASSLPGKWYPEGDIPWL